MGVLEFFGTLIKNDITSSSIKIDSKQKMAINHLLLDFNSIIHVSSQKTIQDVNTFMKTVLKILYQHRPINNTIINEYFKKYKMENIQKMINQDSDPIDVINLFHDHFSEKELDKLIITMVINTVLFIIRTFCDNKSIETLLIAIDGVPSKGKMIEQKQRRYMGSIISEYHKKIMHKYKDYLIKQPDNVYLIEKMAIKWNRNKITPGTFFMHKLVNYFRSNKIQEKIKVNRDNLNIIISDMYEIGEGEKKIVNYVTDKLKNSQDTIVIYSPDADVILLCMLLPVSNIKMLRYNQQTFLYDLIDIKLLKENISYYINNNSQKKFDTNRINYDIVCLSTLFGNDFVPKMETLNVKKGFQNIMDAYLKTLLELKDKDNYLVKTSINNVFDLNFIFLKKILQNLLPEEKDFIKYNQLYNRYINTGLIKNVFDYENITPDNIVSIVNTFNQEYLNLQNLIKNNGSYLYFESNDQFMNSLKKSIMINLDGQYINTIYLSNKEMINLLKKYYYKIKKFPRLMINLNTWSTSILDKHHQDRMKESNIKNEYQKELYKFENMLDEYRVKFNAQPLNLSEQNLDIYYKTYFGINLFDKNQLLTEEANKIMHDYLEGLLWVFDYYFNDSSYINKWFYQHERAPLMRHLLMFLDDINVDYIDQTIKKLKQFQVKDLDTYFNPIEQLIYVSPMTPDVMNLLPDNYKKIIESDPILQTYFVNTKEIVNRLWNETTSTDIDCKGIIFFNKCLLKSLPKNNQSDDNIFLKTIRKVKQNEISKSRSINTYPAL
uniref:Xrn1 N-terminal domain-containing protein n=1 Tax=viral metagenome TaxID=1070528 RepID=A0A6C0LQT8_9ZZZZ